MISDKIVDLEKTLASLQNTVDNKHANTGNKLLDKEEKDTVARTN